MSHSNIDQPEPRSQTRIQSVTRAVSLLLAVAETDDGVTAKELAARMGLSLATTYHLLTTLWAEGMVEKTSGRHFVLGPRASVIAEAFQRRDSTPKEYSAALREVVHATGETAYLGVWNNGGVRVVETSEGAHAVRVVGLDTGYDEDMHARASAKVLLAYASKEQRDRTIDSMALRRLTKHTITSRSALRRELAQVEKEGLAYDREEFRDGVVCVAAPIWRDGSVTACITVSSPVQRFETSGQDIIAALIAATDSLRR